MKKAIRVLAILGVVFALSACNFPFSNEPPTPTAMSQEDIMATAVASAMDAIMATQAAQPTATLPPTAVPTLAPVPTIPAAPTGTVASAGSTTTGPTACNAAEFVKETIPDGTVFGLGSEFTKTWTFINMGTCTWNTNYKLVYESGDAMDAPTSVNLTEIVAPGKITTVSVPMKAPFQVGEYTSYWALQGEDGVNFLTNNSVKIEVATDAFRVTGVTFDGPKNVKDAKTDFVTNFNVSFTASSAGVVNYEVYYYKKGHSDERMGTTTDKLKFDSAGTKTEKFSFPTIRESGDDSQSGDGTYVIKVNVISPNNQVFGPKTFDVTFD